MQGHTHPAKTSFMVSPETSLHVSKPGRTSHLHDVFVFMSTNPWLIWLWVKMKPPDKPQVLVHVSICQGKPFGNRVLTTTASSAFQKIRRSPQPGGFTAVPRLPGHVHAHGLRPAERTDRAVLRPKKEPGSHLGTPFLATENGQAKFGNSTKNGPKVVELKRLFSGKGHPLDKGTGGLSLEHVKTMAGARVRLGDLLRKRETLACSQQGFCPPCHKGKGVPIRGHSPLPNSIFKGDLPTLRIAPIDYPFGRPSV